MALTPIIDTIISLFFLFFFFSVLVSCIQEGTVPIFKTRGKMLSFSIEEILNDKFNKNFGYLLYQHPKIDLLKQKQGELPSYIEPSTFSKALIDLIAAESTETVYNPVEANGEKSSLANKTDNAAPSLRKDVQIKPELISLLADRRALNTVVSSSDHPRDISLNDRYWLGVESLQNSDLKKLLQSFLSSSGGKKDITDLENLEKQIEEWYKGYMERVTGWYKRKIRSNIFFASIAVTLVLNLNFIVLAKTIYASGPLREALVGEARKVVADTNAIGNLKDRFAQDSSLANIDVEAILGIKLPIGWNFDTFIDDLIPKKNKNAKKESEKKDSGMIDSAKIDSVRVDSAKIDSARVDSVRVDSVRVDSVRVDSAKIDSAKIELKKKDADEIDIVKLLSNIFGWLIFALALSRGAPFWFDVLKKFVNIRNNGIAPGNSSGS